MNCRHLSSTRLMLTLLPALLVTLLSACSHPPELIGVIHPTIPVTSVEEVTRHKIFITTTRQASDSVGALFSKNRAPGLGFASVDVTVPPSHVTGQIERPRRLPPDPRTEFSVVDPVIYRADASFIAEVNRELAKRPPGDRSVLLFVHGYNNTTSDSV